MPDIAPHQHMNESGQLFALQQAMTPAALAWGLVDIQTLELRFANPALQRLLQPSRQAPGIPEREILETARLAIRQCMETGLEATANLPDHPGLWHFSPIQGNGAAEAVQCYVLPTETSFREPDDELGLGHVNRFEDFLDHLPYQVWIATPHGEVTWLNRALHEYAYREVRLLSLREGIWIDIVHPDDLATVNTGLSRALITEKPTGYRLRIKRHDGQFHWFFSSLSPVKNAQGRILYWVGANLGIDSVRQSENQLRDQITTLSHQLRLKQQALDQAETYLAQAQKMGMVNQLSAGVAHDMKNLLFITGLHAGMLEKQLGEPEQLEHVDVILNTIQKAGSLASHLTGFSSRKSMQLAAADPRALVQDLEPLLSKAVGQNAELQLHMASSIWPISVDKLYFENSLINLCINARDATEEQGQITLTAENVLLKRASHAGDYVMISVADNGMGMSEEIKARIFDMFFTTKPEGKGAGLGLPMVKNFMDHVQGLIEVESTPGLGTIVSLYFPRAQPVVPQSPQASAPAGRQETILLIEPDLATRNAMAQVLYGLGYQVVTAYLPEVALRYINSGMKVDLIIAADEFSGALSIAKMQEKLAREHVLIPLILMTSSEEAEVPHAQECRYVVLSKPMEIGELARTVQRMLHPDCTTPADLPAV
ncbi:histidine kinase [Comamonas thiooxydans]|nr:histidine kinase [Comamonas thiooxydans]KGG96272.1 histidine kinase [Comamonas thiooxydans]KGH02706.1 histidine kinase [Comamonas thiooxydans]KGH07737.1 histidine kinase [Comamonas thiooxydans]